MIFIHVQNIFFIYIKTLPSKEKKKDDLHAYAPRPPFPQRLVKPKTAINKEVFYTIAQVKINIPLPDAIKQIPAYAKFLKDLCTVKRKMHVKELAFLTE